MFRCFSAHEPRKVVSSHLLQHFTVFLLFSTLFITRSHVILSIYFLSLPPFPFSPRSALPSLRMHDDHPIQQLSHQNCEYQKNDKQHGRLRRRSTTNTMNPRQTSSPPVNTSYHFQKQEKLRLSLTFSCALSRALSPSIDPNHVSRALYLSSSCRGLGIFE